MRNFSAALILTLFGSSVFAETIVDNIHSIGPGENGEEHLVYLENGRVVFIDPDQFHEDEFQPGMRAEFSIDEKSRLEEMDPVEELAPKTQNYSSEITAEEEPTILGSYSEAQAIFRLMNRNYYNKSECTDRAHVWSYEEWKRQGLISRKVFMFFTNTYIRRYNYGWWFHVSPYTLVKNGDKTTEYVMDRRFNSSPRTMKSWSDGFIYSRKECPVTTYHNYRANNNGPEHCYHVKSHMYNRLPLHVEGEERGRSPKTQFSSSEVNYSYRAFSQRGL